jgi:DNA invertase Pin-like site-specific DNA recombinase
MELTAVIYARYSTERQSETSIADQVAVCSAHAIRQGWTVAEQFIDEGISGASFGNRPGAQALEQFALAGGCQVILVTDLTRLSRSSGDLSKFIDRMRFRRVRIVGVQDGYESTSRTARMQAGLSGIMSEEFRAMIADRTRSALSLRAEAGQSTGGRAYGYRDQEGEIVKEVFRRYADGESMKQIASDLNRRGVPSPGANWRRTERAKHGRWLVSALHALLQNERYVGRLIWNRSAWHKDPDTGKRQRVVRPQSEWVVQEIDPIIDRDTWGSVQTRFSPTGSGRGGISRYLLSGLLQCAVCGSKFIVYGGSQHRYICGTRHAGGEHACSNGLSVKRDVAEQLILQHVLEQLLSPEAISQALKEMRAAAREAQPAVDPQVAELERLVREGILSREVAAPALTEARRRSQSVVTAIPSERLWRETVATMREVLQGDDIAAARETLRETLGPIPLRPSDGYLIARVQAEQIMLGTGTGRWVGSGGAIEIHLPTNRRQLAALQQE